jgi:hypothetical protein
VRPFYRHLVEEFDRAVRQSRPLAVVIFQFPDLGPAGSRHWRDLEIALRREVRQEDLPARLTERVAAICLPNTGEGAWCVASRLERDLSRLIGAAVRVGVAYYPLDGPSALELLRTAIWRSLKTLPGQQLDPALQRLIGTLPPPTDCGGFRRR